MAKHEINGKVFILKTEIDEVPFTNPKEFVIKKRHYYIDGIEIDKEKFESEYRKALTIE